MSDRTPLVTVGAQLDDLRTDATRRRLATLGAVGLGLAAVWLHWLGFVLGGALVALAQPSILRGVLAGVGFGICSWLVFAGWLALAGNLGLYFEMGQLLAVSTAIPIAGSLLGSLARGVR
jgi:hypothetical protein